MDTQAIIEDYVDEIAARLPRRLRNDVGVELRTLLSEQLRTAAEDAGRSCDSEMAMDVLRRFGRPEEVAARYAPRGFPLIEPEYSPLVVKLAALCVAIQWAVTLPAVLSSRMTFGEWWLGRGFGAFSWAGAIVLWFGFASWIQRRYPVDPDSGIRPWQQWLFWVPFPRPWKFGEPEAGEWRAALHSAPIGALLTIFFIVVAWIQSHPLPAGPDISWAFYDSGFEHGMLIPLLALMVARLVFLAAALNEQRRAQTETLRFGLWVGFVALLYWALFSGRIFAFGITDALFKIWLLVFLLVNTIQIVQWIRRAATRVRVPKTLIPH